jgi:hypothetical protein
MKRFLIATAVIVALTLSESFAQKIAKQDVPSVIVNNFSKQFSKVYDVEWEKCGDQFKVEFETGLTRVDNSAWYNLNGKMVKHELEISSTALPDKVKQTLKQQFAGFKIDDCKKIVEGQTTNYSMDAEKSNQEWKLIIDSEGKIISKIAD